MKAIGPGVFIRYFRCEVDIVFCLRAESEAMDGYDASKCIFVAFNITLMASQSYMVRSEDGEAFLRPMGVEVLLTHMHSLRDDRRAPRRSSPTVRPFKNSRKSRQYSIPISHSAGWYPSFGKTCTIASNPYGPRDFPSFQSRWSDALPNLNPVCPYERPGRQLRSDRLLKTTGWHGVSANVSMSVSNRLRLSVSAVGDWMRGNKQT